MIDNRFDPQKPWRVIVYLRMSNDRQNKRSPDQQLAEIKSRLQKLGLKWKIVKIYRDDAISGRYFRKREGLQLMLQDVFTGAVDAALLLVDTLERLGRLEELAEMRKNLYEKFGVLVLTADTNFADPTTPQGRVMSAFENVRAVEDGRIKAHNVMRGKRDLVRQGYWPGGPVPFGMILKSFTEMVKGRLEVIGTQPTPDVETAWIAVLAFETARTLHYGQTRLANFLNAHDKIPEKYKPFHPATVGEMLRNPLYKGTLRYCRYATGIVDDTRILRANDDDDVILIPDFCEPIVAPATWDEVNSFIRQRAARIVVARKAKAEASTRPLSPGASLTYPLSGLVRCGHCKRAMTASSSPEYTSRAGVTKKYTSYMCPGYCAGICDNSRRVPEDWLRHAVLAIVKKQLELS